MQITILGTTRTFPDSWNDATPRQLRRIVGIELLPVSDAEKRLRIFIACWIRGWWDVPAQVAWWRWMRKVTRAAKRWITDPDHSATITGQHAALMEVVDPFFADNRLTRNPYPTLHIRIKGRKMALHGPTDGLRSIRGGDWAMAELYYGQWHNTKDPSHLDSLIAALYRPGHNMPAFHPEREADPRQPFNPDIIKDLARYVRKLPHTVKLVILTWYDCCRLLYVNDKNNTRIFTKENKKKAGKRDFGYWGLFRALSGNVISLDKIARMSLSEILLELNWIMDQNEEREKEIERIRKKNKAHA